MTAVASITHFKDLLDVPAGDGLLERASDDTLLWLDRTELGRIVPKAAVICTVPTPDALPSVGHPDVVYIPNGWNGYHYWMAFTPYPPLERENPCIVASHDGITWEVPAGATNPVVPVAEVVALGFGGNSDPDLLLVDNEMWLYYRPIYGVGGEAIYRKTSIDGVTWSEGIEVMPATGAVAASFASPAVTEEADGTFKMWVVDSNGASPFEIRRSVSADGLAWGALTTCTLPSGVTDPWHIDVQRLGDRHYALVQEFNRLYFLVSTDGGLNWIVDPSNLPTIPLTNFSEDDTGNYRSTFQIMPGDPISFDTWLTYVNSPDGNVFNPLASWRIARRILSLRGQHAIWLPASAFVAQSAGPTREVRALRWDAWSLSHTASRAIITSLNLPSDWRRIKITLYWTNPGVNAGNVRFTVSTVQAVDNGALSPGGDLTYGFGSPAGTDGIVAPAQDILEETVFVESARIINQRTLTSIRVNRTIGGNDTLTNAASVIGVLLERVA